MDYFMTMRAFVETVKQGSLTNASRHLGTSRAVISRQVQALEDRLGTRLMNRTTRSVTLTEAGEKYFHFCDLLLAQIAEKEQELADEQRMAEGTLAILAPKWIGSDAAADAVAAFAKAYPSIQPKLSLGGMNPTAYDFLEQGFEVALHTRPIPDSRIKARRIATIAFALCASPDYLEKAPKAGEPADLGNHKGLIQFNFPAWRLMREKEAVKVTIPPAMSANTYLALRRACLAGVGLAILPRVIVKQDLAENRLVEVMTDWTVEEQPLFVAIAPGGATPAKVRFFVDFLTKWFRANPL